MIHIILPLLTMNVCTYKCSYIIVGEYREHTSGHTGLAVVILLGVIRSATGREVCCTHYTALHSQQENPRAPNIRLGLLPIDLIQTGARKEPASAAVCACHWLSLVRWLSRSLYVNYPQQAYYMYTCTLAQDIPQ